MKLSELAEKLRPHIRKMVREEIQAAVKDQLQETVMRSIGEVYIQTLVEEVTARKGRLTEDETDDAPVVEQRRPVRASEARAAKAREAQQRAQMAQMVARNQQVQPAVLAQDNPMRDIYEGVAPLEDEVTGTNIPLEALGLDMNRIGRLNKRLLEE